MTLLKCTSHHAVFLPDIVQWLPLYCIYLKPRYPTTGNRTDPAPFPASPALLCQPGPATLPLLFLEWALPKGICTCSSFCLESTFFDLILEGSFLSFGFQLKYDLITEAFKHTGVPQATNLISLISSWFCFKVVQATLICILDKCTNVMNLKLWKMASVVEKASVGINVS